MSMSRRFLISLVCAIALSGCSRSAEEQSPTAAQPTPELPEWRGIWIAEGKAPSIAAIDPDRTPEETFALYKFMNPQAPWTEEGSLKFAATLQAMGSRKSEGWGFPMMLDGAAPLEFVIAPDQTAIINTYHEVIQIYTDGRDHPAAEDLWPTTWGNSVGHWEGDTLVVDTIAVRDPTNYMFFAPPLSDEAHYRWTLRKTGPDRIEAEFTIEDPVMLTEPWHTKTAYIRTPNMDRLIYDAFVNDRSELDGDVFTIVPAE